MRRVFITFVLAVMTASSLFAQDLITKTDGTDIKAIVAEVGPKKEILGQNTLLKGKMTLDKWSGKLAIDGIAIDRKSTHLYLSPEAEKQYKSGDTISTIGDAMFGYGIGFAGGYLIGTLIRGGNVKSGWPVYATCAGIAVLGIPLHFIGVNKINKAINDYNTTHGYAQASPEVSFGVQNYGIGLALKF